MRPLMRLMALWLLLMMLTACFSAAEVAQEVPSPTRSAVAPFTTPSVLPTVTDQLGRKSPTSTPSSCPITNPNSFMPPGELPSANRHGNDALWTSLWPEGKILVQPQQVETDGSLGMKFPWWRGPGGQGRLVVEGRRLDAPAPPLQAHIPDGYGESGFQSTALYFPSDGCWEITGKAGNAILTFVTSVVKVGIR